MGKKFQRIQDLVGLLNGFYPPSLAEEWDNVGLQVGDPAAPVEKVLVALDPSHDAVHTAGAMGAQVLLTHHPLLFKPLRRLTPNDAIGRTVWAAIEKGVAVFSAHTNLDTAADGLNQWLAGLLGLDKTTPLQALHGDYLKLVVFVPETHQEAVADALFAAGAGQIGAYDQCSFRTTGTGTFRPGEGTRPFIGEHGQREQAEEVRLETIVAQNRLPRVLEKMVRAHPYEEVAYDLIPLRNQVPGAGLGRLGALGEATSLGLLAEKVKLALGCEHLRVVGDPAQSVHKVAVCGGSGADLVAAAKHQGADVLVTGDVKYHDARQAEELGFGLIDAGHFATEQLMIGRLVEILQRASEQRRWEINFQAYTGEEDPFRVY